MNYVKFHKATVDAETGLIGIAIQLNEDQELEDEELKEVDEDEFIKKEADEERNLENTLDGRIITGEWDGEPISREKTSAEKFIELL